MTGHDSDDIGQDHTFRRLVALQLESFNDSPSCKESVLALHKKQLTGFLRRSFRLFKMADNGGCFAKTPTTPVTRHGTVTKQMD